MVLQNTLSDKKCSFLLIVEQVINEYKNRNSIQSFKALSPKDFLLFIFSRWCEKPRMIKKEKLSCTEHLEGYLYLFWFTRKIFIYASSNIFGWYSGESTLLFFIPFDLVDQSYTLWSNYFDRVVFVCEIWRVLWINDDIFRI